MYLVNLLTSSFDFFVYFGNSPNWRKVSSTGHEVTVMLCLNKLGMEGVQKVRELEQLVVADAKNANYLLVIKKQLQDEDISKEERTAALHSLRRIFIHFLESGRLESNFISAHSNQLAATRESSQSGKLQEYQKWLIQQFNSYQATLLKLISSNEVPRRFSAGTRRILSSISRLVDMPLATTRRTQSICGNSAIASSVTRRGGRSKMTMRDS